MSEINSADTSTPRLVTSPEQAAKILQESLAKPQPGRVYDYFLGGNANFAADREFADEMIGAAPDTRWAVVQNRRWLCRAVEHIAQRGIRQFVDMGSGLPTRSNVHQVAARTAGDCRVVYIDRDPVASAHSYLLLKQSGELERNQPINGDLVDYAALWDAILDTRLINPSAPVGLLFAAVLHFVPDDEQAHAAMRFYRSHAAPGSYLAISHTTTDGLPESATARRTNAQGRYSQGAAMLASRDRPAIAELFGDWPIQPPGILWTSEWGGDTEEDTTIASMEAWHSHSVAGIARKPAMAEESQP